MKYVVFLLPLLCACLPNIDGPLIAITNPQPGFLNSSSALVSVSVADFALSAESIGAPAQAGQGHWHLYLNGNYMSPHADADGPLVGLQPGNHQIKVELVNNDHSSLEPPAESIVEVEITTESRRLYFADPLPIGEAESAVHSAGQDLDITVELGGEFGIDIANLGEPPAKCDCEGHIHVYIDGGYLDVMTALTYTIPSGQLPLGTHEIEVRLVKNDHADIEPLVFDLLSVDVQ